MYNSFLPPPPFINRKYRKNYKNNHTNTNHFSVAPKLNFSQNQEPYAHQNGDAERSSGFTPKLNESTPQQSDVLFEIFGLKIYFDDLLIICILFFLYQEGVQDEYLFIALVLLLLS